MNTNVLIKLSDKRVNKGYEFSPNTKMSQDSEDEWEIVEDEIISSYVKDQIYEAAEPKF
jgi:hypothetical protein